MMVRSKNKNHRQTSSARLTAIQALYEIEIGGSKYETILLDFKDGRWLAPSLFINEEGDGIQLVAPDKKKFNEIVSGVPENIEKIDNILSGALTKEREIKDLDVILRSILRAGTFELFFLSSVPVRVIIDEYVELARAFYSEKEPYFVNAIMDNISKSARNQESKLQ